MDKEKQQKTRLGLFVIAGTVLFVLSMYFIGNKQNLFSNTFTLSAVFNNVNGLQRGNNVRFTGIDVGTVQKIEILNDTSIRVDMIVKESIRKFIKKDAIASIGTDGLMGNKLVNISPGSPEVEAVQEYDMLPVLNSLDADDIMRRLENTNQNVELISTNLVNIIEKVNEGQGVLGKLIMDTTLAKDLTGTLANLKKLGEKTVSISEVIEKNIRKINIGEGTVGALLSDTIIARNIQRAVKDLVATGEHLGQATEDMKVITRKINEGQGLAGTLLNDSTITESLEKSMENIEKGSAAFNENMEALKQNILFRRYFRKQEKKKKKQ